MKSQPSSSKRRFRIVQGILSIGGFSILAGMCGFGATWLVVGIIAAIRFKTLDEKFDFAAKSMPILIAGGILGFVVGFMIFLKKAKAGPKIIAESERKYIRSSDRLRIYFGFPVFFIALLTPLFERLPRLVGEKYFIYVTLGIALAVIALSLVLFDRIPKRFIVPIGIIGWMLTLSLIAWFFFFGPGSL